MGRIPTDLVAFLDRVHAVFPLRRAVFFGSRQRDEALDGSDFDLVLVSHAFAPLPFWERLGRVSAFWQRPEGLDALCYTPAEYAGKLRQFTIVREAVRTGVRWPSPGRGTPGGDPAAQPRPRGGRRP